VLIDENLKTWRVDNVVEFVEQFNFRSLFKKLTGMRIDEWNYEVPDDEIIIELLKIDPHNTWGFEHVENYYHDYFKIYLYEPQTNER